MSGLLAALDVLVLDCQATGATPAHGDLLELGWGRTGATAESLAAQSTWVQPTGPVPKIVRQLTGWSEAARGESIEPLEAWARLRADASGPAVPTVIHFARFELAFLRDLHGRAEATSEFPFDAICVHSIAERIFPDLPRRNLRALSGHLGHSADLVRRASGHATATAFIWRALLPHLAERGILTWEQLRDWLATPEPRRKRTKRVFPLAAATRRALPDAPGVYRFLRPNGDVLYVGKATSLKKRVASHFGAGPRTTERALEMLSQVHDIRATTTASILEAALLETDEIKRIDPPYNVQLRTGDRAAWFATADWTHAASTPDAEHAVGPLPSRYSLAGLAAVRALLEGAEPTAALRAAAVEAPLREAPDAEAFAPVWTDFVAAELTGPGSARRRLLAAGARLASPETPPDAEPGWNPARIRRHLERAVIDGALLVRRARLLSLLAWSQVTFQEPGARQARRLVLEHTEIISAEDAAGDQTPRTPPARLQRLAAFEAQRYDRLRVLATELQRIESQGGSVRIRVGRHLLR